jgi:hypothetical protein
MKTTGVGMGSLLSGEGVRARRTIHRRRSGRRFEAADLARGSFDDEVVFGEVDATAAPSSAVAVWQLHREPGRGA